MHVRGFKERGTTTTPFDMVMLNDLDRFHLVMDVIDRVDGLASRAALLRQRMADARLNARATPASTARTTRRSRLDLGVERAERVTGARRPIGWESSERNE